MKVIISQEDTVNDIVSCIINNKIKQQGPTMTDMPNLGLKVKARNKGETNIPSPYRHNLMIRAFNCRQDTSCQEPIDVKQSFLPYDESDLYNDYILKDPNYIDRFCFNFPFHYVLGQVHSDTNFLDNMVLWKKVVRPTKKPRSVEPNKSKPEKTTSTKETRQKTRKSGKGIYRYLRSLGV